MSEPIISVCLPVYNEAATIDRAVHSVTSQSVKNIELIIVDNCSTDGTYQKIQRYMDPRIQIYRNESNLGWRLNSNLALSKATGKYVVTLHGGDYYHNRTYLERVVKLLDGNPLVGVIHFVPLQAFQKVFSSTRLMRNADYYSFIASLRYMPAPPVTAYRNEAIIGSQYYEKNFWTGEARLSLHIARRGYDALIEVNRYITRTANANSERTQPVRVKERYLDRLDFFMEFKYDPNIKKQDILFLQKSLNVK